MIEFYQFPFSHFCEKARWALDYKGVAYRTVNYLPVFHFIPVRTIAPKSSVPVLRDGKAVVQGSGQIIDYLDRKYPESPLTPHDPEAAKQALEWERYCDEEIGVMARRWFYYHALADRRVALSFLLQGAPRYMRPFFRLAFPLVRLVMLRFMDITAETAAESEKRLLLALKKLDRALEGRRFLVGDRFSRADLTACALLSPVCLPDDCEAAARFPAAALRFREDVKHSRVYAWVRSVYESCRLAAAA
jgi:glutathione S-transferase